MFRVLVLIGAVLFFRAVLPRTQRWSSTTITPYMSALDGMMSAKEVSSVLDEVTPYESWLIARRANTQRAAQHGQLPTRPRQADDQPLSALQTDHEASLRR